MSLAAVDWLMSLDPHWYSTIYGLILVVGQGLSALSFARRGAGDAVAARADEPRAADEALPRPRQADARAA